MIKFDTSKFPELIANRLISCQKHPTEDLYIYNYTPQVQFNKLWTPETSACRGLILDGEGNIVARPFSKFFNIEEHKDPLPNEPFVVSEKMDGSLGILYWIGDVPYIASRGSFTSPQAIEGTKMLRGLEPLYEFFKRKNTTFLFEIIYPENRIVVDYKGSSGLIHLATINNNTGLDIDIRPHQMMCARRYDCTDIHALRSIHKSDNKEGFVVTYKSGLRIKLKFEEYVRLHRLVTGLNNRVIWEALAVDNLRSIGLNCPKDIGYKLHLDENRLIEMLSLEGRLLDRLVDGVPDELYDWVKSTSDDFAIKFYMIENEAKICYRFYNIDTLARKQASEIIKRQPDYLRSILFSMMDNKEYSSTIWKLLYPKYCKPYFSGGTDE